MPADIQRIQQRLAWAASDAAAIPSYEYRQYLRDLVDEVQFLRAAVGGYERDWATRNTQVRERKTGRDVEIGFVEHEYEPEGYPWCRVVVRSQLVCTSEGPMHARYERVPVYCNRDQEQHRPSVRPMSSDTPGCRGEHVEM